MEVVAINDTSARQARQRNTLGLVLNLNGSRASQQAGHQKPSGHRDRSRYRAQDASFGNAFWKSAKDDGKPFVADIVMASRLAAGSR